MEIGKLYEFMKNCCRVCLSVENEMLESSNIVENFNKTIDQLLFECANLKVTNDAFLFSKTNFYNHFVDLNFNTDNKRNRLP